MSKTRSEYIADYIRLPKSKKKGPKLKKKPCKKQRNI